MTYRIIISAVLALVTSLVLATEPPLTDTSSFVVFPQDCNSNNILFGGKALAEMDRCAGIAVRRALYKSPLGAKDAVTIAINNVKFHKSAKIKDLIVLTGAVTKIGEKSLTVQVTLMRETAAGRETCVEGEFVFVAYDVEQQKAIPHGLKNE